MPKEQKRPETPEYATRFKVAQSNKKKELFVPDRPKKQEKKTLRAFLSRENNQPEPNWFDIGTIMNSGQQEQIEN